VRVRPHGSVMLPAALEVFQTPQFVMGARCGAFALAVGVLTGWMWRRRRNEPAPIAGILFVAASLAGLAMFRPLPPSGLTGLALLALAGSLSRLTRRITILPALVAAPGAWLLAFATNLPGPGWVRWLAFGSIAAGAPLAAAFDSKPRRTMLGPVLFAVSVAGVFATVPDTEEALLLLGAIAPVALLAWPFRLATLGDVGSHIAVGLLIWVAVIGGEGRSASVIGASGCLAILALEPIARSLPGSARMRIPPAISIALHLAVVYVASRVAGLRTDPVEAALATGAALLAALVTCIVIDSRSGRLSEA
jgi:hypothetical protein